MGVMTGHFDNNLGNLIKLKLICVSGDCDCPLFGKAKSRCKESGWHFNYSCKFPYIIDLPFKNLTKSHASQKDKKIKTGLILYDTENLTRLKKIFEGLGSLI